MREITIKCQPSIVLLDEILYFDEAQSKLVPEPPEETMHKRAIVMDLKTEGSIKKSFKETTLEFLYRYSLSQYSPKFDDKGIWIPADKTIILELVMFVRKISKDGRVTNLGGSSVNRLIKFDEKGDYVRYDNRLQATIKSPKIYQMAYDNPNATHDKEQFPDRGHIYENEYIQNELKLGYLDDTDYESASLECYFNY